MGLFDKLKENAEAAKVAKQEAKAARETYDLANKALESTMLVSGSNGGFKWDDTNRFFTLTTGPFKPTLVVKYDSLVSYRVDEQIVTTEQTKGSQKKKGTLTRAAVGTIIMPGVGTVVGGLTGKKVDQSNTVTSSNIVRTIVISRDDAYIPVINASYNDALIMKLDQILSERNSTETSQDDVAPSNGDGLTVADELLKLKGLLDAGVLTDDEFQAQKAKLLQ
ncbi:SHOCT domain-containing protein [Weissella cibaria]|uniref:SHOCT domain-containing protein n=1 Tax=Weissella cibaria TaxID=137591 RepID=UPI0020A6FA12|nr:SHOCT domain-containing protein [Weissella cibaria]